MMLTCSVVVSDADGEIPTESYTWQNLTTGQALGGGQTLGWLLYPWLGMTALSVQ